MQMISFFPIFYVHQHMFLSHFYLITLNITTIFETDLTTLNSLTRMHTLTTVTSLLDKDAY